VRRVRSDPCGRRLLRRKGGIAVARRKARISGGSWFYASSFNGRLEPEPHPAPVAPTAHETPSGISPRRVDTPSSEDAAQAVKALALADLLNAAGSVRTLSR
jgi:hypothetical protein